MAKMPGRQGHLLILRGAIGAGKSSVGRELKRLRPDLEIIEIDDLKRAAYGTTAECVPALDYPKAGALARKSLDQGCDTVVIEPLWDRWHLRSVVTGAGRFIRSEEVSVVWLECSLATAIQRKSDRHEATVVAAHHFPVGLRDRPRGEIVIDTESHTPAQIAAMLLELFRLPHA